MKSVRALLAVLAIGAIGAIGVGCGGDDTADSGSTTEATTTAATTTAATTTAATTTAATTTETESEGDVAAGKTVYENSCQACHPAGGTEAGAGPKLAAAGLTAEGIKKQIEQPVNAMPPNLVSGEDLENVTAYLLSIQ